MSGDIGIIGGGMMGLATAFYLTRRGHRVTIIEKETELGGLSRADELAPGLRWDRFYHVILTTDTHLKKFVSEIGLELDLKYRETRTGFYWNRQLLSMSSTMEFLRFKPLSLADKLRLAIGILYCARIRNWRRLEKLYVKTWLIRVFGRRNYETIWEPLLRAKLGHAQSQVSAAFIWATIKRLYGTRQSNSKKEMMGCVRQGYFSILNSVQDCLLKNGSRVMTDHSVGRILEIEGGRIRLEIEGKAPLEFDRVISTLPNPVLLGLLPEVSKDFISKLKSVTYLGLVCATLLLKHRLTPYYIINIIDASLPFTGIIEGTNLVPPEVLKGNGLIYLPRYLPPGDPYFHKSRSDIAREFLNSLKQVVPHLSDDDVLACKIHRERYVQPLQEIEYSQRVPPFQTPLRNLLMVNTAMIVNSTLNNNQVIQLAQKAAALASGAN